MEPLEKRVEKLEKEMKALLDSYGKLLISYTCLIKHLELEGKNGKST